MLGGCSGDARGMLGGRVRPPPALAVEPRGFLAVSRRDPGRMPPSAPRTAPGGASGAGLDRDATRASLTGHRAPGTGTRPDPPRRSTAGPRGDAGLFPGQGGAKKTPGQTGARAAPEGHEEQGQGCRQAVLKPGMD
ncbi:translation initiation factor IF-2-like [Chiroxiphia lanceolata]|uniref:translation initiation factor IF-2-like n=1 Tax=Chiroxiphia lanceolata TaxID=296741 RepID=UPI0013CEC8F2|nr:translation initiation factor IF-2-like [Chiroxiphia lanceolata]